MVDGERFELSTHGFPVYVNQFLTILNIIIKKVKYTEMILLYHLSTNQKISIGIEPILD